MWSPKPTVCLNSCLDHLNARQWYYRFRLIIRLGRLMDCLARIMAK